MPHRPFAAHCVNRHGIRKITTREERGDDALALASHQRAVAAIQAGRFTEQIVPVSIKTRKGEIVFDTDEGPRADVTAEQSGITPLARLVGSSLAAVDPKYMGIGPVPAIVELLVQTGVNADDIDVWEINEAFAAQALAVAELQRTGGRYGVISLCIGGGQGIAALIERV